MKAIKVFFGTLLCLAALVLTAGLLAILLLFPSGKTLPRGERAYDLASQYDKNMQNRLLDAISGITAVKKTYWIPEDAPAAPMPDGDCFGRTEDPSMLQWVLEKAQEVLEGQTLFFTLDAELLPGSQVNYYLDETILALTWKQEIDNMAITFAEVKVMDPSQFRRYLSGNEFASGKLMLTTEMSQTVNAVVACSGDYYGYRPDGSVVIGGKVMRNSLALPDTCYIDENGDMILRRREFFRSQEEAQAFVDEHHIRFSLAFGPILVLDGEVCPLYSYSIGEVNQNYARAGLGQLDRCHYLYVACNQEGNTQTTNIGRFARLMKDCGCVQAYNLDGGQTATVVMRDQVINQVNYGAQRRISDIIYFATAKPGKE